MAIDMDGDKLKREIGAIGSEEIIFHVMSIADEEAWKEAVQETMDRFGRVDVLVNNAGRSAHATILESTVELWRNVLEVNLIGQWLGMREVIPYMREQGGGSIVNCGSNSALQGGDRNAAAYCAAKGGVRALTKHAAMALGQYKIRVNCVHPGPILTELAKKIHAGYYPGDAGLWL